MIVYLFGSRVRELQQRPRGCIRVGPGPSGTQSGRGFGGEWLGFGSASGCAYLCRIGFDCSEKHSEKEKELSHERALHSLHSSEGMQSNVARVVRTFVASRSVVDVFDEPT